MTSTHAIARAAPQSRARKDLLLPSSIAGLLSGAIPLFTFVCGWLFMSEEHIAMTRRREWALAFWACCS